MIIYFNLNKIEYLYNSILLYKHSKQSNKHSTKKKMSHHQDWTTVVFNKKSDGNKKGGDREKSSSHEGGHLIVLEPPEVLRPKNLVAVNVAINSQTDLLKNQPALGFGCALGQLDKKVGFERCRDAYRFTVLRTSKDVDNVLSLSVLGFPGESLEQYHLQYSTSV